MSIVLGYADKEQAIIMSDGRAGENGTYNEYYDKTVSVNDNVIMGVVGFAEEKEILTDILYDELGENRKSASYEDVAEWFISLSKEPETPLFLQSTFMIAGIGNDSHIHIAVMGHQNAHRMSEIEIGHTPKLLSIGQDTPNREITQKYREYASTMPILPAMRKTIDFLASVNSTVNCNQFFRTVRLRP